MKTTLLKTLLDLGATCISATVICRNLGPFGQCRVSNRGLEKSREYRESANCAVYTIP